MEHGGGVRGRSGDVGLHAPGRDQLRERQKRELREERDRVVLDLAASLTIEELARSLCTTAATAEMLVRRARGRVSAAPREISARRIAPDGDRWGEADRHYAALGRRVRLPG